MISLSHNIAYVHIHKAAGTSIIKALEKGGVVFDDMDGHKIKKHNSIGNLIQQRAELFKERNIKSYSFVRNPYDIMVSKFFYFYYNDMDGKYRDFILNGTFRKYGASGFNSWIDDIYNRRFRYKTRKILQIYPEKTQTKMLCVNRKYPSVDFIGKFENLETDFQVMCNRLNIENYLHEFHENKTPSRNKNYLSYYNSRSIKYINEIYSDDFEVFGYDKIK